jgi:hypothetical protein
LYSTAADGAYYLEPSSPLRDAGTTNITAALLAELRTLTTYQPSLLTNTTFVSSTILGPVVPRDAGGPDLGYHYPAIDYLVSGIEIVNTTLLITNGAAIGWYGSSGITLTVGSEIHSFGRPDAQNRLFDACAVQEFGLCAGVPISCFGASTANHTFRFTEFIRLPGLDVSSSTHFDLTDCASLKLRDCSFLGGYVSISATQAEVINNCFQRVASLDSRGPAEVRFHNNLVRYGQTSFDSLAQTSVVSDNVFDSCSISNVGSLATGHNALLNALIDPLPPPSRPKTISSSRTSSSKLAHWGPITSKPRICLMPGAAARTSQGFIISPRSRIS